MLDCATHEFRNDRKTPRRVATEIRALSLVVIAVSLVSCAPSDSAIEAAIVQTQAARATTSPHVDLPTPTVTPALFHAIGQEFLPTASEMPEGFKVDAASSGPSDDGQGYALTYSNPENILNGHAIAVLYQTYVRDSVAQGKEVFQNYEAQGADLMASLFNASHARSASVTIPGVEASTALIGTFPNPSLPEVAMSVCGIAVRSRNLVLAVFLVAIADGTGGTTCIDEAKYYISLALPHISPPG